MNHLSPVNHLSIVALVLALFSGGCGSSSTPGNTNTTAVTFTQVYSDILSGSCVTCHSDVDGGTGYALGALDLSTQSAAYANLQKSPAGAGCKGLGFTLVVPGDAATSLLVEKVESATPPCGSEMPFGCGAGALACLSAAQVQEITDWINGGAKND
jgi:hypothetical protein